LKILLLIPFIAALAFAAASMAYLTGPDTPAKKPRLTIRETGAVPAAEPGATLRLVTLNVAHGRGDSLNQIFLNRKAFDSNLEAISRTLRRTGADIVALQEVDGESLWSGSFDHAERLAAQAGYPWRSHAEHASSWLFSFGTAVLSRLPIVDGLAETFPPSPPTLRKGFVISQVAWPHPDSPADTLHVDIVSVHLDFLSRETRTRQIDQLVDTLSPRRNPLIVLGDFNSEWQSQDSPVQELTRRLNLQAFRPQASHLATHQDTRIDWIFLSPGLEFRRYEVLPEVVSDHQAVVADVAFSAGYVASLTLPDAGACRDTAGCTAVASAVPAR